MIWCVAVTFKPLVKLWTCFKSPCSFFPLIQIKFVSSVDQIWPWCFNVAVDDRHTFSQRDGMEIEIEFSMHRIFSSCTESVLLRSVHPTKQAAISQKSIFRLTHLVLFATQLLAQISARKTSFQKSTSRPPKLGVNWFFAAVQSRADCVTHSAHNAKEDGPLRGIGHPPAQNWLAWNSHVSVRNCCVSTAGRFNESF